MRLFWVVPLLIITYRLDRIMILSLRPIIYVRYWMQLARESSIGILYRVI